MPELPGGEVADSAAGVVTRKVGPLPVVVWVAIAAGAIGLYFAFKQKQNASNGSSSAANQFAGPGAAASFASVEDVQHTEQDIIDQLTGGFGDISSQLGTGFAGVAAGQQSLAAQLQNLQQSLDTFSQATKSQMGGLLQAVQQGNASVTQANQAIAQLTQEVTQGQASAAQGVAALAKMLQTIQQQNAQIQASGNANAAAILQQNQQIANALQTAIANVSGQVAGVSGQVGGVQASVGNLSTLINQYINQTASAAANALPDFSPWNGQLLYSEADSDTYMVINGKLYEAGYWARNHNPGMRSSDVNQPLKQWSQGTFIL